MIRKASMLKAFIVFVAVCGLSLAFLSPAQAQEKEDWYKPITQKGSAAFMFTIDGLAPFNVGGPGVGEVQLADTTGNPMDVSLMGAGFKYYVADNMALRVGLGFNHQSFGADSVPAANPNGLTTNTAFGVAVGFEDHPRALYSTSPYFGAQVSFAHGSVDNKRKSGTKDNETETSSSMIGVGALAGFDWFVSRAIAIGAEVTLGWSSTSASQTYTDINSKTHDTDFPSSSTIALSTEGLVHVVVYF